MSHISTNDHPRFAEQLALEEEMRCMGITRFREAVAKAQAERTESRTQSVRRIMGHHHQNVVEGIEAFLAAARSGKAGRKHNALRFMEMVGDNDVLAHMTLRAVLDGISKRDKLPRVALALATMLEDEVHYRAFEEQLPTAFKAMSKRAEKATTSRHRRNAMLIPARKMGVELDEWGPREKLLLGTKLIEILVETTGLAKIVRLTETANSTPIHLEPTPETLEWIKSENAHLEWLTPVYLPTVVPPKPWTTPFDGGYWSGAVRRLTLVKTRNKNYLNDVAEREMPVVYAAVNALQETPWRINAPVLEVMETLWAGRSRVGKLPSQDTLEEALPPRPVWLTEGMTKEEMDPAQLTEFKAWKRDCAMRHEEVAKARGKRIAFMRMLSVARKFKDQDAFYFPHQLDWRGRIYPAPLYLTPQGNDTQKGLLELANAVPLTDEDGVRWLAIHGAGLWGVDKVDMEERVAWVEAHSDEIVASAADPYANRFWTTAEDGKKAWEALAFCHEWAGYKRDGFAHESHLQVQMDGTCNGLQNFSAILRDEIGGEAVNLLPGPKPRDIYSTVAEKVAGLVERDLTSEARVMVNRKDEDGKAVQVEGPYVRDLARAWHGYLNRKVTKRPVMTLAYGAREFGFKTQVFEDTVMPWKNDPDRAGTFPFEGIEWAASAYMGQLIWDAVGTVVVAAANCMEWLQKAARITAKEGLPVNWRAPSGFIVQQAYRVPNQKRIALTFESVEIRLSIDVGEAKIDTRKQASGIAPNWVHSLDASHMASTIARAYELGLRSFSMIHDSYGTHAGNAQLLANTLRECFVEQYRPDVLAGFRDDLEEMLEPYGVTLPPLPPKGTLDLEKVLESPFFFA